jgi:hypothetical protein
MITGARMELIFLRPSGYFTMKVPHPATKKTGAHSEPVEMQVFKMHLSSEVFCLLNVSNAENQ